MRNPFRKPVPSPTASPRACPVCGCPLEQPGWRTCPRCRQELDACAGCSACGKCRQ